jgi:hypothetical protein
MMTERDALLEKIHAIQSAIAIALEFTSIRHEWDHEHGDLANAGTIVNGVEYRLLASYLAPLAVT